MPEDTEQHDSFENDGLEIEQVAPLPSIYTLSQAPFIACLIEEHEGLEIALRRANDCSEGDQNGPDLEGHILQALSSDFLEDVRAHIDWKSCEFYFSEFDPPEFEEDMYDGRSIVMSGHPTKLSQCSDRTISSNVKHAWDMLIGIFLSQISASRCAIFAKRNSPFTQQYEQIAPDVWRYFTMVDWEKGTAKSPNGEYLFSIMVAFANFKQILPLLNESKSEAERERDVVAEEIETLKRELDEAIDSNRSRPALRRLIGFFYRTYPEIHSSDILDHEKMDRIRRFTGNDNSNHMTGNRAKNEYIRLREMERQITARNNEEYDEKLRAFLTENVYLFPHASRMSELVVKERQ